MSDHLPIVIVLSEGTKKPEDIIANIRKVPISEGQVNFGTANLIGLKYHLVTKYYETDILFLPYDQPLSTLPSALQIFVEGLLIYFDAHDRDILTNIKEHLLFLDSNHIEMVVLLCEKLFDEERLGITYKEIKQSTRLMDIIELARTKDDADTEKNYDHHDPVGYDELLQVLQNFLWSNVELNGAAAASGSLCGTNDAAEPVANKEQLKLSDTMGEEEVEAELAGFEKLLTGLMMFKNNSASLSQNERLAYTHNFADAFDDLIGDGPNSSDDDDIGDDFKVAGPPPTPPKATTKPD